MRFTAVLHAKLLAEKNSHDVFFVTVIHIPALICLFLRFSLRFSRSFPSGKRFSVAGRGPVH